MPSTWASSARVGSPAPWLNAICVELTLASRSRLIAVPRVLRALTTVELLTPDGRRSVTICIRYQAMMLCWVETQVADGVPVSRPAEFRRLSSHLVVPPASASYSLEA